MFVSESDLHKACREHLESLGVTLWADFMISNKDQREAAIEWFMKQYLAVEKRLLEEENE